MEGPNRAPSSPPGDAHTQIVDARFGQSVGAPAGVLKEGVSAVHDDIAFFQQGNQLIDDRVHRRSGLDHQHDLSGAFQRIYKFLQGIKGE